MAALSNLDAFVVGDGLLKLLPQSVEEAVHVVGRFQVRRLHDVCRFDDPLLLDHRGRRRHFARPVVLGLLLLGQLAKELLDAPHGGIELLDGLALGLGDVGEAFFLLHLLPQGFERLEARRPQAGFALGRGHVLVQRGDVGVDLGDGLRSPPGEQRRVHGIDRVDEGVGFLDESVGTAGRQDFLHSLEGGSGLGVLLQFQPVELEGGVGLAELFPGRLLVIVKVFQVVKLVGQIEQVFLQRVEPLDELLALLVGERAG